MKIKALLLRFTVSLLALLSVSGCRLFMWENFTNDLFLAVCIENQSGQDLYFSYEHTELVKDSCIFVRNGDWITIDVIALQEYRYRRSEKVNPGSTVHFYIGGLRYFSIAGPDGSIIREYKKNTFPEQPDGVNILDDPSRYRYENIPYADNCKELTSWGPWTAISQIMVRNSDMKAVRRNGIEKYAFTLIYSDLHNFERGF